MKSQSIINGQEILGIITEHPHGIRLSGLLERVAERFGSQARFHTSCQIGLDVDELLVYLEAHDKIMISNGVVFSSFALIRTRQPA